jgi:uncharacterized membrane protein
MNPSDQFRCTPWHLVLLGLILVLAAGLRFHGIRDDSLVTDEFFSLELSTARGLGDALMPMDRIIEHPPAPTLLREAPPWYRTWHAMRDDTHPPLHPLVLRLWRETFGEGEVAARSLSAVTSIIGIIFLFIAVRFLHGTGAGLWAALLMSVAAPQIEFAQFVRNYAMLITTVAACCAAIAWIVARGPTFSRCALLTLALLIAMFTHYAASGPLAGLAIFALMSVPARWRFRVFFSFLVAAVVYAVIWAPFLLQQRPNFSTNMLWTIESADGHLSRTLQRVLRLPIRFFFEPMTRGDWIAGASAIFYVLPLVLMRRRPAWLMWWLILIGAVASVLLADLLRGSLMLNLPRYTIAGSIAVYAMTAAVVELSHDVSQRAVRIALRAVPAVAAVACALTLPEFYQRRAPDFRDMGSYLADRVRSDDVILIMAPSNAEWTAYVLQLAITHYAGGARCPMAILSRLPDEAMLNDLERRAGKIWIVGSEGPEMFPAATYIEGRYFPFIARVSAVRLNNPAQ